MSRLSEDGSKEISRGVKIGNDETYFEVPKE